MATNPQCIGYRRGRQTSGVSAAVLLAVFLAATWQASAFQAEHPISGRKIAGVMGVGGADWLERHERESEERPTKALDALGLKAGMVVADVGAGTGFMSLRMAERVGPTGKVYANDIQPEMLRMLRQNAAKANIGNVETAQLMLRKLREALKPDGRLVLLEYRKEDPSIPIRPEHKMSVAEVKLELEAENFQISQVIETLPRQHIFILIKKHDGDRQ